MRYNDSDMDDLFRRASERYPLRTDSADWDRLAGALDGEPAALSDGEDRRRRRGVFWWFLLIPLAGIGYWTWHVSGDRTGKVAKVQVEKAAGAGTAGSGAPIGGAEAARAGDAGTAASRAGDAGTAGAVIVNSGTEGAGNATSASGTRTGGTAGNLTMNGIRGGHAGNKRGTAVVDRNNLTGNDVTRNDVSGNDVTGSNLTEKDGTKAGRATSDNDPVLALLDLRRAPIGGRNAVDVNVVAPKKMPADSKNPKRSHGYIGLFGAPDFSVVRFQSMKGVGTTFGVMLGYSFNDRWAVETGLYLDRKRYYTEGEYFNTDKVRMPPGYSKLLNVDGTCNMWEIPVNVRYNFNTSQRIKWFATAGLSTYLMTSEKYTALVQNGWITEDNYWNIHKPSQYWFSIANVSAGFEQRIGKIGSLRLEPYVRIPLSGIGTGSLHIVSAGLNIGLVHQLW